jgi:prepilin-type N-terminal cleavage/methylation domain-containing protein
MRRKRQRGMTLIELMVAMAVTSILLVGLTSAFFNVSSAYEGWAARLQDASVGTALAAGLQADAHRYVVCGDTPVTPPSTLALCSPSNLDPRAALVTYQVNGIGPWVITRQAGGGKATFLARSATDPSFWIDCKDAGSTVSGHVHLYDFRRVDGLGGSSTENYSVYYVAPWRPGC